MRVGTYTLRLKNQPRIVAGGSAVGKKEGEGPLQNYFDHCFTDTTLGEKSWEKAESDLQQEAVKSVLEKSGVEPSEIQYLFAGDLLNQCISSVFGLRSMNIPFLGQYGACSTMAQTLGLAAVFVDSGLAQNALAVTSSHFCSAERQFRFPLEYGGQRTPTAQWTVTGAGAILVGQKGNASIEEVTFGRMADLGVKDAANMGAAMAPAAAQTIEDYLKDTGKKPEDFDLILTGDLGQVGSTLLREILNQDGINIERQQNDCGLMVYDRQNQDVHAGGSGCGCSAAVFSSYVLQKISEGDLKHVLFIGTGALMSPTSSQQGETIPGVAHLVHVAWNAQA